MFDEGGSKACVEFFPQGCFKHYEMLVVALTTQALLPSESHLAPSHILTRILGGVFPSLHVDTW